MKYYSQPKQHITKIQTIIQKKLNYHLINRIMFKLYPFLYQKVSYYDSFSRNTAFLVAIPAYSDHFTQVLCSATSNI